MRINILSLVLLFFCSTVYAQVRVGEFRMEMYGTKDLKEKDFAKLKNRTFYFTLNKDLLIFESQLEDVLEEVWTIGPYEVIDLENEKLPKNVDSGYCEFDSTGLIRNGKYTTATSSFFGFDFHTLFERRKNFFINRCGAIYFTPDVSAREDVVAMKDEIGGDLINYRLGYIKNGLQFINYCFENGINHDIYDDYIDKDALKKLKTETLYFSDDLNIAWDPFLKTDKEGKESIELFEDYEYQYEIVDNDFLDEKILDSNNQDDFYYLMYNQLNSNKVITVINGLTGKIIYQEWKKLSFNVKDKDIKQLSKQISKL